jgi:hypothetical protein
MKKESFIKAALIFGGGYLLFSVLKSAKTKASTSSSTDTTKSFDSSTKDAPAPTPENAKIVLTAYSDALNAGESPSRLSELNKECMKEFGMRCYVNNNEVVVCDVKGNPVSV